MQTLTNHSPFEALTSEEAATTQGGRYYYSWYEPCVVYRPTAYYTRVYRPAASAPSSGVSQNVNLSINIDD